MLEAVRRVKETLGPDAVILASRRVRKDGGLFGLFGRPVVEVTAAIDRDARAGADVRPARALLERVAPPAVDGGWGGLRLARALVEPLENELRALRGTVDALAVRPSDGAELAEALADLRRRLEALAAARVEAGKDASPLALRLRAAGLAERHVTRLLDDGVGAGGEEGGREPPADAVQRSIARKLEEATRPPRWDDDRGVTLFVGPTGVGKTTTLAKVAAHGENARVDTALVTTDTYRVAAGAQLRTFAHLLGVPFDAVVSSADLVERVRASGGRHVLVDTAGRSRFDEGGLAELASFRHVLGDRARVNLVLSATTQEVDLRGELQRYAPLRPDALVVTKLDESASLAPLANLLLDGDTPPLEWVTDGQRVPENLEPADPARLASQLLEAA